MQRDGNNLTSSNVMASQGNIVLSNRKTSLIPQSTEEEDLITRSSKKIKNGISMAEDSMDRQWPRLGSKEPTHANGSISFADMLKGTRSKNDHVSEGNLGDVEEDLEDDSMSDDGVPPCEIIEDPNRSFPTFVFSVKMKKRMYRVWNTSVSIKLLGRNIGYRALETRVQSFWAKRGIIRLINIGHGYFVVKFSNKEDYMLSLTGGPWMIYDHYLIVRPWEPQFNSATAKIDKAAVWVRLPSVFLEYYDEEALKYA